MARVRVEGQLGIRPGISEPDSELSGGAEVSPEIVASLSLHPHRRLGVLLDVDYRYVHLKSPTEIERLTAVSPETQAANGTSSLVASHSVSVRLAAGPRLGGLQRHGVTPFAGLALSADGATTQTNTALHTPNEGAD